MLPNAIAELRYRIPSWDAVAAWTARLPQCTPGEAAATAELQDEIERLGPLSETSCGDADRAWVRRRIELRRAIRTRDPRQFLRWTVIRRTMVAAEGAAISVEYAAMQRDPEREERWNKAIRQEHAGFPKWYSEHPGATANSIHLAYHILRFERATGKRLQDFDSVLEIGGGYGGMCAVARQLGFAGSYVIFDLPEFSALQRYYLRSTGRGIAEGISAIGKGGTSLISDVSVLRTLMLGRYLLIATWSLSEMDLQTRAPLEPALTNAAGGLIAFQKHFRGMDNSEYFLRAGALSDAKIQRADIGHLASADSYIFFTRE